MGQWAINLILKIPNDNKQNYPGRGITNKSKIIFGGQMGGRQNKTTINTFRFRDFFE